jgi:hypothetical protein
LDQAVAEAYWNAALRFSASHQPFFWDLFFRVSSVLFFRGVAHDSQWNGVSVMGKKKAVRRKSAKKTETTPKKVKAAAAPSKSATKKTDKPKSKAKKYPDIDLFVVCDSVTKDAQTGRHSLLGLFDKVAAQTFPIRFPRFATFAKISGGSGIHQITFDVIDPDGTSLDGTSFSTVQIDCDASPATEITVEIAGLIYPSPGIYQFVLRSGNRRIGKPYNITVASKDSA